MPRPRSKKELLLNSNQNFEKLNAEIAKLNLAQQKESFPEGTMNRNIRDVLMHLHHWHLLMLEWHRVGMSGEKPSMPAEGFT